MMNSKWLLIPALLLTASAALARPMLFCRLEKLTMSPLEPWAFDMYDVDNAAIKDLIERRVMEHELKFDNSDYIFDDFTGKPMPQESVASVIFSTGIDSLKLIVKLAETAEPHSLQWRSHIFAVDEKTNSFIAGADGDALSFKSPGGFLVQVFCDAYEKTETLAAAEKLTALESARQNRLGGAGLTRQYVQPQHSAYDPSTSYAVYDLFQQLTHVPGAKGDQLRAVVKDISDHGGANLFDGAKDNGQTDGEFSLDRQGALCHLASATFLCDRERFALFNAFWEPRNGNRGNTYVDVKGFIDRESGTHRILGYEITSVSTRLDSPGGMSNSSGGRINGGK